MNTQEYKLTKNNHKGIIYESSTYEVTCDCEIKEEINFEKKEAKKNIFNQAIDSTNLKIVVCYRLLFDFDNYINNYGFFIYCGVFIFMVILVIYYFASSKNSF